MSSLQLYLFGTLEIRHKGRSLPLPPTQKSQSLLAYLVVHRHQPHHRERLAAVFWADRPENKARRSLNTALWHIRQILPSSDHILADKKTVQFDPRAALWLDTDEFSAKIQKAESLTAAEKMNLLWEANALYRGEFLEGFYDDWCLEKRYRLESRYLQALEQLSSICEKLGQPEQALQYSQQYLTRDPLHENVQRAAIRLLVQLDARSTAIRQACQFRALLKTELGVEPTLETITLCEQLLGSNWQLDLAETGSFQQTRPPHRHNQIFEQPLFVGRSDEWNRLLSNWEKTCSGAGQLLFIKGPAGIGKTRLIEELGQYTRQRGFHSASGHCFEYERALPHGPLAEILRVLLPSAKQILPEIAAWQAAELVRLAPELSNHHPDAPASETLGTISDEQDQSRLFEALVQLLTRLAEQNPLLIILEDLHWAGESILAWLHYLGRRLPAIPLMLVGSYRTEEVTPRHTLFGLPHLLEREGLLTQMELQPLSKSDLTRWFSGSDEKLVSHIYNHSEGNPFFTLEILHALVDEKQLQYSKGRWVAEHNLDPLPLPASVRQVVLARLGRLAEPTRMAAGIASVIGRSFDFSVLRQIWDQDEETVLQALDELLRTRLVRETKGSADHDYDFSHHLIRKVLYQNLHYRRRQRVHRLAAAALQQILDGKTGEPGEIAHHYAAAGKMEDALAWYQQAAQKAQAVYAGHDALNYFDKMLDLLKELDPDCAQPELQIQQSKVISEQIVLFSRLGKLPERDAALDELVKLARRTRDQHLYLQTFIHRVRYQNLDSHYEQSIATAAEGIKLAQELGETSAHCRLLAHTGFAHYFLGQPHAARAALETGLTMPGTVDDPEMQGRINHYLGYVHFHLADYEQALTHRQAAYTCSQMLGNSIGVVWGGLDIGAIYLEMGRFTEARQILEEHLELARKIGSRSAEAFGLNQIGIWKLCRGQYAAAEADFRQAIEAQQGLRREHIRAEAEEGLGLVYYHLGDLKQARIRLEQAVAHSRSIRHCRRLIKALIGLGLVEIAAKRFSEACLCLEDAVTVARESESWADLAAGLAALARAIRGAGEPARALAYAEEGIRIASEKALVTTKMWAELETGLTLLALGKNQAAEQHIERADALTEVAHHLYLSHEQVRQAYKQFL